MSLCRYACWVRMWRVSSNSFMQVLGFGTVCSCTCGTYECVFPFRQRGWISKETFGPASPWRSVGWCHSPEQRTEERGQVESSPWRSERQRLAPQDPRPFPAPPTPDWHPREGEATAAEEASRRGWGAGAEETPAGRPGRLRAVQPRRGQSEQQCHLARPKKFAPR